MFVTLSAIEEMSRIWIRITNDSLWYDNRIKHCIVVTGIRYQQKQSETVYNVHCTNQGFGSELDPDSIGPVDPDPDPGGQKWPTKVEKKL